MLSAQFLLLLLSLPAWSAPEEVAPVTVESADGLAEEVPEIPEESEGDVEEPPEDAAGADARPSGEAEEAVEEEAELGDTAGGEPAAAFAAGDYASAARSWRAQVKAQPDRPALRYRHAASAALAGDLSIGRDDAAHAERLDPGNPAAIELAFALHKALISKDDSQDAAARDLELARRALADGRLRTAERLAARGLAVSQEKPTSEVRAALQRVRGQALLALGRAAGGQEALKSAAGAGQHDLDLWRDLAESARRSGASDATRSFQVLADIPPGAAEPDPPPVPMEEP